MRPTARKTKLVWGVALAILTLVVVVVMFFRPSPLVRSLDPRLEVLSVRVLRNPNDTYYLGNPGEGWVRAFLRQRVGLTWVAPPEDLRPVFLSHQCMQKQQGAPFLVVRYRWDDPAGYPNGACPELIDASGCFIPACAYLSRGQYANDPQLGVWSLKPGSNPLEQYRLRPHSH